MIFFWFALLSAIRLIAFEFSWEKIHEKLNRPLPDWMRRQIEEDLEPFASQKIASEAIEETIRDVCKIPSGSQAGFVRYQIRNNKISVTSPTERQSDARIAHVVEVLEDLAKGLTLPDVDFLAALWDSYDNPIYLEKTRCPVFTICKLKRNRHGVLIPEFRNFSYRQRLAADIHWHSERSPWNEKIPKAFWRGMTSGWNYTFYEWDMRPRSRLVLLSQARPDLLDAAFTSPFSLDESVKNIMERYRMFQPWKYPVEFVNYKYLVSIDGNTFASNLWWQLLSNSAVMKNDSEYLEWFYKGIEPFVHYLPYALDLSDFVEKVGWLLTHDREGRQIADRGREFALEHLSNESLVVYFYRLLEAYAALQKGGKPHF